MTFLNVVKTIFLINQVMVGLVDARSRNYEVPRSIQFEVLAGAIVTEHKLFNELRGGEKAEEAQNSTDDTTEASTVVVEEEPKVADYSSSPYSFPLYQPNDGSEDDPDGIPRRYMKMQNDKRPQAKKALEATLQWRKENDIDVVLAKPHSNFDIVKKVFPHFFMGRDDTNHVIFVQRPGLIDLPLAEKNGLKGDDLLYHYIYAMEYLWRVIELEADATMVSVIDLTGLNLSVLRRPELIKFVKLFCSTMDAHFPQRAHKTLLINSPKWFGTLYKLLSPLLRESTKEKISIHSKGKAQDKILQELSTEYTLKPGQALEDLAPSMMEDGFRNFCLARLNESNQSMKEVLC